MAKYFENVPFRTKSGTSKYPPWQHIQDELSSSNLTEAERLNKFEQRWLYDKKSRDWKRLKTSQVADISEQLDPRKREYVLGVSNKGPYTEIIKHRKTVGEWGPDGQKKYASFGDSMRVKIEQRWSRLGRGAKCVIISVIVTIVIGIILTAILVPLYVACTSGGLTGAVCRNLGVKTRKIYETRCTDETCQNGGTCSIVSDGYRCKCNEEFTGEHCNDKMPKAKVTTKGGSKASKISTAGHEATHEETVTTEETTIDQVGRTRAKEKSSPNRSRLFGLVFAISIILALIAFFILRTRRKMSKQTTRTY